MIRDGAHVETRLPVRDLERAREWYRDKLGLEASEEREGGLRYEIEGNYPSKGSGERATWIRDVDGNLLGIAELLA